MLSRQGLKIRSANADRTPESVVATRNCAARAHITANVVSLFRNKLILKILTGPSRKSEPAISRVLSRTIIHLGRPSPAASSNLPGNPLGTGGAGFDPRIPLFGLAPGGVYRAASCYQSRGALLPHLFTLTCPRKRRQAVYFLWHFPWAHAPQVLPGALSEGARTFLYSKL